MLRSIGKQSGESMSQSERRKGRLRIAKAQTTLFPFVVDLLYNSIAVSHSSCFVTDNITSLCKSLFICKVKLSLALILRCWQMYMFLWKFLIIK